MFEKTVESAAFPVLWEVLNGLEKGLAEARVRLNAQYADSVKGGEHIAAQVAQSQLQVLNVWEPSLLAMMRSLSEEHEAMHGSKPSRGRRS